MNLLALLLLVSWPAHSMENEMNKEGAKINFSCGVPTTQFNVYTEGDLVVSQVDHPYGIQYTPMFRGAMSGVTLDQLQAQKEILSTFGKQQKFTWLSSKCTIRDKNIFECSEGEKFEVGGYKIRPITLRTIKNHLSMTLGDYDIYSVEIVFVVDNAPKKAGLMFSLSSDFQWERHCHSN